VRNLVGKLNIPIVLDADGINAFKGNLDSLKKAKKELVMTPHAGEMARLLDKSVDELKNVRKEVALSFANEYNTVLVLKGHNTVVASPGGDVYINETGNPGMASGGVGDVLTGIITGFIGQGMKPFDAAVLGVYAHGLAGDMAAKDKGQLSLVATDLLNKLPEVLKTLS
jgi:NAD(P)H-hydrate epimerase